jgi:ATP-dependent helicase/DNAse subunit B
MIALASPVASSAPAPAGEEIIGQLQKKVSASRLTLFLQCRLKFFFRYVAGLT